MVMKIIGTKTNRDESKKRERRVFFLKGIRRHPFHILAIVLSCCHLIIISFRLSMELPAVFPYAYRRSHFAYCIHGVFPNEQTVLNISILRRQVHGHIMITSCKGNQRVADVAAAQAKEVRI